MKSRLSKHNMKKYNLEPQIQRGPPPDPRHATRRAHQQPRTGVTDAIRGSFQQPRTGMRHTIRGACQQPRVDMQYATRGEKPKSLKKNGKNTMNICTYNTRTINDLNTDALDTMLYEIENINWDVIGFFRNKS